MAWAHCSCADEALNHAEVHAVEHYLRGAVAAPVGVDALVDAQIVLRAGNTARHLETDCLHPAALYASPGLLAGTVGQVSVGGRRPRRRNRAITLQVGTAGRARWTGVTASGRRALTPISLMPHAATPDSWRPPVVGDLVSHAAGCDAWSCQLSSACGCPRAVRRRRRRPGRTSPTR